MDYCHDRSGGQDGPPNHRFAILASFYISSPFPLGCKCSVFCISIPPTRRWILASVEHSLGKICNSCIIFMLRYALCPIQHYGSCKTGAVHSTLSEGTWINSDIRKTIVDCK
ncbi:uncharacterized protein BJ212DRAFT_1459473 [Suillus subaureus]|uniref:Uncharacterized protein n=1 Tax=Suillus subaureus TaxID=48587 RepID=A0A9P7JF78_9AGAM|nr:uncharacterized protein BJ212DRAFT_1459473 [Suillus subaureus]KAG1819002.1 hypothetical protein BJ212DRAFT_1459473 [Suillus subaureus]